MKRILMLVILLCIISSTCFAAKLAYEPESPTSASFSATDEYMPFIFITFVNYAKSDENSDYWVRFTITEDYTKILYNAALNIDGTIYDLHPVYNIESKYYYAASSNIPNHIFTNMHGTQPFRYYVIPLAVVNKLKTAKKITFIYNRVDKLNLQVPLYDNYVEKIKSILDLKYADLGTYFHPSSAD
ncbi:hypothetical protein [Pectinatus haikarae]|uniref:hypothetical protein n=1 Tax=Pectinatus haikarae TaxID=349096 RepID=UPI0018C7FB7C|nr:hypothetical protein [Pectinatus haikarae]